MTFNTGHPVPSTDPRNLYDNAENLDKLVNGVEPFVADRLGVLRESWAGMENTFDTSQTGRENAFALSQDDKESRFQAFLVSSGYVSKGDYAAGVILAERNEYVAVDAATTGTTAGLYRPGPNATLPLTLTGTWATDSANLVLLGDDVLRQELASTSQGAPMVARASVVVDSIATIASLPTDRKLAASVANGGRAGFFTFQSGDYSAQVTADPMQGVYIAPASDSSGSSGAWIRQYGQSVLNCDGFPVGWFGALGNGVTDDSPAIQAACDFATFAGVGRVLLGAATSRWPLWLILTRAALPSSDSMVRASSSARRFQHPP